MSQFPKRRHSLWYERLIFSGVFQFFLGAVLIAFLPLLFFLDNAFNQKGLNEEVVNSVLASVLMYCMIFVFIRQLRNFPGAQQTVFYILPTLAVAWLINIALLSFFRLEYSRYTLLSAYVVINIWAIAAFYIRKKYRSPKLALVPLARAGSLQASLGADIFTLETQDLQGRRFDAVVADLHSNELPAEWEKFLARCTLAGLPVFHYKQIEEMMTGRVGIEHMAENEIGSLLPSPYYMAIKRIFDCALAILLLPAIAPFFCIIALAVKLDSKGPVLFIQERVGFKGDLFLVFKFRSMYTDIEGKGFTESSGDPRITRVGKVIRKFRLDELPQIINVLKGEMSFIGPRPESKELANSYEEFIPFFSYRHIIRPGISGWAQVNQGYAADLNGMKKKLQYDFYYIKHFSIWLDILIFFKTIRTVCTGFGAR